MNATHDPMTHDLVHHLVLARFHGSRIPDSGDAAMIAAGALAGEGRLKVGVAVLTSTAGWLVGYEIGPRSGRALLEHPGRLEKSRRKSPP